MFVVVCYGSSRKWAQISLQWEKTLLHAIGIEESELNGILEGFNPHWIPHAWISSTIYLINGLPGSVNLSAVGIARSRSALFHFWMVRTVKVLLSSKYRSELSYSITSLFWFSFLELHRNYPSILFIKDRTLGIWRFNRDSLKGSFFLTEYPPALLVDSTAHISGD